MLMDNRRLDRLAIQRGRARLHIIIAQDKARTGGGRTDIRVMGRQTKGTKTKTAPLPERSLGVPPRGFEPLYQA
jgi:hypothetical protein